MKKNAVIWGILYSDVSLLSSKRWKDVENSFFFMVRVHGTGMCFPPGGTYSITESSFHTRVWKVSVSKGCFCCSVLPSPLTSPWCCLRLHCPSASAVCRRSCWRCECARLQRQELCAGGTCIYKRKKKKIKTGPPFHRLAVYSQAFLWTGVTHLR